MVRPERVTPRRQTVVDRGRRQEPEPGPSANGGRRDSGGGSDEARATLDPTNWRQDVIDRWAPTDHDLNPTAYEWHNPTFKPKRK
jgi:hypothetical protein